jgi:hypothetical protein
MVADYNLSGYGLVPRLGREFLRSYGFFWVWALLSFKNLTSAWRFRCVYLIGASLCLCFVATDWSRMLGFAFPGIFIPVARLVDVQLLKRPTWLRTRLVILVLLAAAQCHVGLFAYEALSSQGRLALIGASVFLFVAGSMLAFVGAGSSTLIQADPPHRP